MKTIRVSRTELRKSLSCYLSKASGGYAVEVFGTSGHAEQCIVDKHFIGELLDGLRAAKETIEVLKDPKLFKKITSVSATIDEDIRLGKLHSLDAAFEDSERTPL